MKTYLFAEVGLTGGVEGCAAGALGAGRTGATVFDGVAGLLGVVGDAGENRFPRPAENAGNEIKKRVAINQFFTKRLYIKIDSMSNMTL